VEDKTPNEGLIKEISRNLEDALKLSKDVYVKLRELQNENMIKDEKENISEICYELGKFYENIDNRPEFAEKVYVESLNNLNTNEKYDTLL